VVCGGYNGGVELRPIMSQITAPATFKSSWYAVYELPSGWDFVGPFPTKEAAKRGIKNRLNPGTFCGIFRDDYSREEVAVTGTIVDSENPSAVDELLALLQKYDPNLDESGYDDVGAPSLVGVLFGKWPAGHQGQHEESEDGQEAVLINF
jgi:hypothetical protein